MCLLPRYELGYFMSDDSSSSSSSSPSDPQEGPGTESWVATIMARIEGADERLVRLAQRIGDTLDTADPDLAETIIQKLDRLGVMETSIQSAAQTLAVMDLAELSELADPEDSEDVASFIQALRDYHSEPSPPIHHDNDGTAGLAAAAGTVQGHPHLRTQFRAEDDAPRTATSSSAARVGIRARGQDEPAHIDQARDQDAQFDPASIVERARKNASTDELGNSFDELMWVKLIGTNDFENVLTRLESFLSKPPVSPTPDVHEAISSLRTASVGIKRVRTAGGDGVGPALEATWTVVRRHFITLARFYIAEKLRHQHRLPFGDRVNIILAIRTTSFDHDWLSTATTEAAKTIEKLLVKKATTSAKKGRDLPSGTSGAADGSRTARRKSRKNKGGGGGKGAGSSQD